MLVGLSATMSGFAIASGCSIMTDLTGFSNGERDASANGGDVATIADVDAQAGGDSATTDGSSVPKDATTDVANDVTPPCTCGGLVSAYRFADPNALGHDAVGPNHMMSVKGMPKQSPVTPPGLSGHSIQLDGSSSVCIPSGFTFDPTSDHTLCWWSQATVLGERTNQFAQECAYDTWTSTGGANYLWRINNCNTGTPANLDVPNVYAVGKWVQICQTYVKATMTRSVVINGDASKKASVTDTVPIVSPPSSNWCIGSYGGGGYWTGLIFQPMWFDRVLSDTEIASVAKTACCLP